MTTTQTTAIPTGRVLDPTPFPPVQDPTGIIIDLFPARVTLPAPTPEEDPDDILLTTISQARVIITANRETIPDHLYVFVDSTVGPALVYSAPTATTPARTGNNHDGAITTTAGTISYTKDSGCGCGSALKSFAPFSHPYSVA